MRTSRFYITAERLSDGTDMRLSAQITGNFHRASRETQRKCMLPTNRRLKKITGQLSGIDFGSYDKVLFLSKSIGTALAAFYDAINRIGAGHVYYTPVEASFQAIGTEGIVFHGTGDDWAKTEVIVSECEKRKIPLYLTEHANHSMETGENATGSGDYERDHGKTEDYIREFSARNE